MFGRPDKAVDIELAPGDLALWGLLTVHGSNANTSGNDRGEWAFRDSQSVPLGYEPVVCTYQLVSTADGYAAIKLRCDGPNLQRCRLSPTDSGSHPRPWLGVEGMNGCCGGGAAQIYRTH